MTRVFWAILFYIIAIPAVIIAQRLFQSVDLGLTLNIYVFIGIVLYALFLMVKNLRVAVIKPKETYTAFYVHVGGILFLLYLIFFDQLVMMKH